MNSDRLCSHFTVRTSKVRKALLWPCQNHEDYRHVKIDEERIAAWNATEVAIDLMHSISYVSDPSTEDASRSGFATEDPDSDEIEGDIPSTVSGMIDVNNTTTSPDIMTLLQAAQIREQIPHVAPQRHGQCHWIKYIKRSIRPNLFHIRISDFVSIRDWQTS